MGRLARYKGPEFQADFLQLIRGGASRMQACDMMHPTVAYGTLDTWLNRDDEFKKRVEKAEAIAKENGAAPTPSPAHRPTRATPDRWETFRSEAASMGAGILGYLLRIDATLSEKGFATMPPWWRWTFERFYASGKRWLAVRAGRGSGKSTMLQCRPCVTECLFGDHSWLGPGEFGCWPLMSTDMAEANSKVGVIVAVLESLGVEYAKTSLALGRTQIKFQDASGKSIEVRVYPATVAAASGPTLVGFGGDEEAKWRNDSATGTSGAKEVLAAIGPAFRTREGTHGYRSSSAYVEHGTHYDDIERGDTRNRHVARIGAPFIDGVKADLRRVAEAEEDEANRTALLVYAEQLTADSPNIPTSLANPSIDLLAARAEAETFDDFMREYVSRSSGSEASSFFDGVKLSTALARTRPKGRVVAHHAAIDPGAASNAFALSLVDTIETPDGETFYAPCACSAEAQRDALREWVPSPGAPLDVDRETLPEAGRIVRKHGCEEWTSDTFMSSSFQLRSAESGLVARFVSSDAFGEVYGPARRALHRGQVVLSGCDMSTELRRQLTLVQSKLTDGGVTKIIVREEKNSDGGRVHGDLGVAFVRALAAAGAGRVEDDDDGTFESLPSRYASELGRRAA